MDFIMCFTVEVSHESFGKEIIPQQRPNILTISQLCLGFLIRQEVCLHLLRKALLP